MLASVMAPVSRTDIQDHLSQKELHVLSLEEEALCVSWKRWGLAR